LKGYNQRLQRYSFAEVNNVTITQWKKRFVGITYRKFARIAPEKRLKFFLDNVRDAKLAVMLKEGIIRPASIPRKRRGKLQDYKHRIAAVFPDLFLLCDLYEMDLDRELARVMKWFRKQKNRQIP
jgi:hypothetical protein